MVFLHVISSSLWCIAKFLLAHVHTSIFLVLNQKQSNKLFYFLYSDAILITPCGTILYFNVNVVVVECYLT